jgi:hypothetical protein
VKKIYQPFIIEKSKHIIGLLEESNFFNDYEIEDTSFAQDYISNILTEKFITGDFDFDEITHEIFTENEFDSLLKNIIAGSVLEQLKKKGMVDSYEDTNSEEMFFITEKGKEFLKKNNN